MSNPVITYSTPWSHIFYSFAAPASIGTLVAIVTIAICISKLVGRRRPELKLTTLKPRVYYFVIATTGVLWVAFVLLPIREARALTISSDTCRSALITKFHYGSTFTFERLVSTTKVRDEADIKALLIELSRAEVDNRTHNWKYGTVYVIHFFPANSPYGKPLRLTLTPHTKDYPNLSGVEFESGVCLVSLALCNLAEKLAGP